MSDPQQIPEALLAACDREPIHIPGSIQPHGVLFVLDPDSLEILQISANADRLIGTPAEAALGRPLGDVAPGIDRAALAQAPAGVMQHLGIVTQQGQRFHTLAHRSGERIVLELEEGPPGPQEMESIELKLLPGFLQRLSDLGRSADILSQAAADVRALTGFDRALIYRFDEDRHGTVVAEDRNDVLPSYLDLRFPASDIPQQARDLYLRNPVRQIVDADYSPVPLVPALDPRTGRPIDLSYAALRSVSPVHQQYMRNMGTPASFSVAIIRDDRLWGLISCHHAKPRLVPPPVRVACNLLGQILSSQLTAKAAGDEAQRRGRRQAQVTKLLGEMVAAEDLATSMLQHPREILELVEADGAAVVSASSRGLIGRTPPQATVDRIVEWLKAQQRDEPFATDCLSAHLPQAADAKDTASGLLAIPLSELHASYLLWFRGEVLQTVHWGGDPAKPMEPGEAGPLLSPRRSFETWRETVRLHAAPWRATEIEAAAEFRQAVLAIVLRRAEELAALSEELARSNKELEAFSYSVSHDLRAPLRHIVGYSELLREQEGEGLSDRARRFLANIIDSAFAAGRLVDDLLSFSQMGRVALNPRQLDLNRLVEDVRRRLQPDTRGQSIEWVIPRLDAVYADPVFLTMAMENLLSNAVKFTRERPRPVIEIGTERRNGSTVVFVRDNGVGFEMAYVEKLFGVFQRLHRMEDYEGTGIGLANVRRIVERHGGRTWAEGELDQGATFWLSLPNQPSGDR